MARDRELERFAVRRRRAVTALANSTGFRGQSIASRASRGRRADRARRRRQADRPLRVGALTATPGSKPSTWSRSSRRVARSIFSAPSNRRRCAARSSSTATSRRRCSPTFSPRSERANVAIGNSLLIGKVGSGSVAISSPSATTERCRRVWERRPSTARACHAPNRRLPRRGPYRRFSMTRITGESSARASTGNAYRRLGSRPTNFYLKPAPNARGADRCDKARSAGPRHDRLCDRVTPAERTAAGRAAFSSRTANSRSRSTNSRSPGTCRDARGNRRRRKRPALRWADRFSRPFASPR